MPAKKIVDRLVRAEKTTGATCPDRYHPMRWRSSIPAAIMCGGLLSACAGLHPAVNPEPLSISASVDPKQPDGVGEPVTRASLPAQHTLAPSSVVGEQPGASPKVALPVARAVHPSLPESLPGLRKITHFRLRNAPLQAAIDFIAQVSGLNFIIDPEVRTDLSVSVELADAQIGEVLHLLLTTHQLKQRILNQKTIIIYPATPHKLREYQPVVVRSFYLDHADPKTLAALVKTLTRTQDIVADERLGAIILRDTPEIIGMAERIIRMQDLGDPEVVLEVSIYEVKRARLLELGVQWPMQLSLAPLSSGAAAVTLRDLQNLSSATTQASLGTLQINARRDRQDALILANPSIRVRHREKARVLIGDRVPVITSTSTSTGFVSESINYLDVGLKLEVEPAIYRNDEVAIKINLEVSSLVKEITSKAGSLAYQIGTRSANTVLRLKDGETQVLAGLISNEDRKARAAFPGLGELPVLGRLFGSQKDDGQRSEILLSITPRIVRRLERPDAQVDEFFAGSEARIGERPLQLSMPQSSNPAGGAAPMAAPTAP